MIRKSILLIIILCISLKNDASPYFSVSQLNCEQIENPIAIDTQKPRFSWKIHSQQRGFEQFAYQIIVSDSPDLLSLNKGNMWNSGKVVSPTSLLIEYNGKPLQSQKEYYWKVRIWDKENNGVRLTMAPPSGEALNVCPRPVFWEELDFLGLNRIGWKYPHCEEPLLWACDRRYFYKGEFILETIGGNLFDSPKVNSIVANKEAPAMVHA